MRRKLKVGLLLIFIFTQYGADAQQWTLQKCLHYAAEHNHKIIATHQKAVAATFDKKTGKTGLIPEINLQGDLNYYWQIPVQVFPGELVGEPGKSLPVRMGTPWMSNVGLAASWDIINPVQWSKIKVSKLKEQLAKENTHSYKQALNKNIRMSFYQTLLLHQNIQITNERLNNYRKIHVLIKKKLQKGLINKIAFNQSLSILEGLKDTKLEQEKAYGQSLLSLKFWMGYSFKDALELADETLPLQPIQKSFNPDLLPGYAEQSLELQIAKQQYQTTKSDLYPRLSIVGGYSELGFGQKFDFITQSQWFASGYAGLQLEVPILAIGKMFYQPKKQKALIAAQKANLENFTHQKEQEFLQKKLAVDTKRQIVASKEKQWHLAKENVRLSYQKIQKGIIDMIELKQMQQDMNDALTALNKAKISLLNNHIELQYMQSE